MCDKSTMDLEVVGGLPIRMRSPRLSPAATGIVTTVFTRLHPCPFFLGHVDDGLIISDGHQGEVFFGFVGKVFHGVGLLLLFSKPSPTGQAPGEPGAGGAKRFQAGANLRIEAGYGKPSMRRRTGTDRFMPVLSVLSV